MANVYRFLMNKKSPSLEKLCTDLIAKNFERFYFAFTITNNIKLKKKLALLQRRFSVQLLNALSENENLKEEYLELFINEQLDFLDDKWFKSSRYQYFMEDVFCRLPNLTRICFSNSDDEILEHLPRFCPKIVEIDARSPFVTDEGLEYLCKSKNGKLPCPDLKTVFVEYSDVTDKGVECLIRNLPLLESIDYGKIPLLLYSIHEENLRKYDKVQFFNLVKLNFFGLEHLFEFNDSSYYTDVLKVCLTACPKLESLACYIFDEEQLNLFTNSHLKELHLKVSVTYGSININNYLKLNGYNLTSLKVSDCTLSVPVLSVYCPMLKNFVADCVNFTDDDECFKPNFTSLTECLFVEIEPSFNKAICLILSSSPKLESVCFKSCIFCPQMKTQILLWCKTPVVKKIQFCYIKLELKFLRGILLNSPSLKEMWLSNNTFDDIDPEMVENNITDMQNVAKSLPNKPEILLVRNSRLKQIS